MEELRTGLRYVKSDWGMNLWSEEPESKSGKVKMERSISIEVGW